MTTSSPASSWLVRRAARYLSLLPSEPHEMQTVLKPCKGKKMSTLCIAESRQSMLRGSSFAVSTATPDPDKTCIPGPAPLACNSSQDQVLMC